MLRHKQSSISLYYLNHLKRVGGVSKVVCAKAKKSHKLLYKLL